MTPKPVMILEKVPDSNLVMFFRPFEDSRQEVPAFWSQRHKSWMSRSPYITCTVLKNLGWDVQLGPEAAELVNAEAEFRDRLLTLQTEGYRDPFGCLWEHQARAAAWLWEARRGLLADEPGVGKTLALLAAAEPPILVICPASVVWVWADAISRWTPWKAVVVQGTAAKRKKQILDESADVVIVHWGLLQYHSSIAPYGSMMAGSNTPKELQQRDWATVIADEAHRAKNPKAKRTRAWWQVSWAARRSYAATGTPVANQPDDFWSLLHGLWPNDWASKVRFLQRWCMVEHSWSGYVESVSWRFDTHEELQHLIRPYMLRRTKDTVHSLPEMVETYQRLDMPDEQSQIYEDLREAIQLEFESGELFVLNPLTRLIRLLQAASAVPVVEDEDVVGFRSPSCKLSALADLLEDTDEPVVVFAVSRKLVEWLSTQIGEPSLLLTGQQSPDARRQALEDFGRTCRVLFATYGAGGEGIDLTVSALAIMVQRPWSLTDHLQALHRIHRPGQTRSVEIIHLVSRGTVEEAVIQALATKERSLQTLVRDKGWWKELLSVPSAGLSLPASGLTTGIDLSTTGRKLSGLGLTSSTGL